MSPARVIVIGGTDSSGGAGVQADLRALASAGVDAGVVVTAVTAQTMSEVHGVEPVSTELVHQQLVDALHEPAGAVKVGLLPTRAVVETVAALISDLDVPVVIDPVFRASAGAALATGTLDPLRELLAAATVVTPNVSELSELVDSEITDLPGLVEGAARLCTIGPQWVLATGGHLGGPEATDVLTDGERLVELSGPRVDVDVRGTGCTLASLAAGHLARGQDPVAAAQAAKAGLAAMLGNLVVSDGRARFGPG